ncbi:uncharacterized protein METZ01_LOCUS431669, partial [marine metagenome]
VTALAVLLTAVSATAQPVADAARAADWDRVRSLVAQRADVTAEQGDGATALHWAGYWDAAAVASLLLDAGADASAANDLGATPLWTAAENGSAAMTDLLLAARADPTAALLSGETVLMTAARTGNV